MHQVSHNMCKESGKIKEGEHGSLDTPSANRLRCEDISFRAKNWLKPSKMHFFDLCQVSIRVLSLYSWQKYYKGIGESLVAHHTNFHD